MTIMMRNSQHALLGTNHSESDTCSLHTTLFSCYLYSGGFRDQVKLVFNDRLMSLWIFFFFAKGRCVKFRPNWWHLRWLLLSSHEFLTHWDELEIILWYWVNNNMISLKVCKKFLFELKVFINQCNLNFFFWNELSVSLKNRTQKVLAKQTS